MTAGPTSCLTALGLSDAEVAAAYAALAGAVFTGAVSGPAPAADAHLATKAYVDGLHPLPPAQMHLTAISTDDALSSAEANAGNTSQDGNFVVPTWTNDRRYIFLCVRNSENDIESIATGGIDIFVAFDAGGRHGDVRQRGLQVLDGRSTISPPRRPVNHVHRQAGDPIMATPSTITAVTFPGNVDFSDGGMDVSHLIGAFVKSAVSDGGTGLDIVVQLANGSESSFNYTPPAGGSGGQSAEQVRDLIGTTITVTSASGLAKLVDDPGDAVALAISDGGVAHDKIADNAVRANTIQALAVTTAKLANLGVTHGKLANNAVQENVIQAGAVTETKLADGSATAAKIGSGAVLHGKIADNAVRANTIQAGAVTTDKMPDDAVTHPKLADSAIHENTIQTGAVTEAKIAAGAVTGDKIGDGEVTQLKIAAGAVRSTHIAGDAVVTAAIAPLAVTGGKLAASAVTSGKLGNSAVTETKIQAGAVTTATSWATWLSPMTRSRPGLFRPVQPVGRLGHFVEARVQSAVTAATR